MPLTQEEANQLRTVSDVEWDSWTPIDIATLLFVFKEDKVLLIRKRRGLGQGKINAPGGRLEEGETIAEAAVREVQEELCITPLQPRYVGENLFQFTDGYSLHVHVFTSTQYEGVPQQTDEAIPLWFSTHDFPFDEMWADDRLWIPLMMQQKKFHGRYIFSGDEMLDHNIQVMS